MFCDPKVCVLPATKIRMQQFPYTSGYDLRYSISIHDELIILQLSSETYHVTIKRNMSVKIVA